MKKSLISARAAAVLMTSAAAIDSVMTPTRRIVDTLPKLDIEAAIPQRFGDWPIDIRSGSGVVNRLQTGRLNLVLNLIGSRANLNSACFRIMGQMPAAKTCATVFPSLSRRGLAGVSNSHQ